jgi:hypothetical protein
MGSFVSAEGASLSSIRLRVSQDELDDRISDAVKPVYTVWGSSDCDLARGGHILGGRRS